MNQISTLHINNFKFFGASEPINIDGKHLLLYGENGSGKSSLFWALYTLLESVQKPDQKLIQYFTQGDDAGLVNIYAQPVTGGNWNSFISLTLTDGSTYRVAVDDFSVKARPNAQATHRGSDFLNYRFMFKLHDRRHKEEIDLFELFQKEVFPYMNTRARFQLQHEAKDSQDFNEIWDDLAKGPLVLAKDSASEDDKRRNQKIYADKLRAYVEELRLLSRDINGIGNQLLQQQLGYPQIRFEVDCEQKFKPLGGGGELSGRPSDEPEGPLRLTLTIPEYDGMSGVIKRPQSFLNEAKLTAIGIAIRLAIIQRRADYARKADFQLLVLDDLLISLDMSNRRKVLDLLLTQYAPTYQLFVLTHDRSFYHFAEKKIKNEYGQEDDWQFMEMYQDGLSVHPQPYIANSKQNLKQAEDFFNERNYPACGLYLRRDCERILNLLLPDSWKVRVKNDGTTESKNLNDKINSFEEFCLLEGIDYTPYKPLKIYKDVILNTLSHDDSDSPLYVEELKAVLEVIRKLGSIKRSNRILKVGEDLLFRLNHPQDGRTLAVSVRTREQFVLLEEDGKPARLSHFGKCEVRKVNEGTGWIDEHQGYDDLKSIVDFYKQKMTITDSFDMLDFLICQGNPLRDKLNPPTAPVVPTAE